MIRGESGPAPEHVQRFFYIHLPKTGGTTLLHQFRQIFPDGATYPIREDGDPMLDGPQFLPERLEEAWERRGDEIRLVIGHFPFCVAAEFPAQVTTMTMLREPVSRTLSFLRHYKRLHPKDRGRTLEELYEDPFRFESMIQNQMVKMLGMESSEMTEGMLTRLATTDRHLHAARANLERVDTIGVMEDFEAFRKSINLRYGFGIPQAPPVNTSEEYAEPVNQDFVERIRTDNALDVELYQHALELISRGAD